LNFDHIMAPKRYLRIIFSNLESADSCLTNVIKFFADEGSLRANIEDNIKLGLKIPLIFFPSPTEGKCFGIFSYHIVVQMHT